MNRQKADRVLMAAFAVFAAAVLVRWFHREAVWAQAIFRTAEAALVGGVADWFAVTALFRRPLGIAFHTAIIPRNREKIVQSIAYMVQEEFLSRQSIQRHLQKLKLVKLLINWIEDGGKVSIFRFLERIIDTWLAEADRMKLSSFLTQAVQVRLRAAPLHRYVPALGRWLLCSGKTEAIFDLVVVQARQVAERPSAKQDLYHYLEKSSRQATGESTLGRMFGAFLRTFDFINLDKAAEVLHQRLLAELQELEQPDHPLRRWLTDRLVESLSELEHNTDWQTSLEQWKSGLIDRLPLEEFLKPLVHAMLGPGEVEADSSSHPLTIAMLRFADMYWQTFRQDIALQDWLERHLQEAATEVVLSEHSLIGELVGQALGTLSDDELNAFIEDKVGEDLAWIRVNGSVVGALAGLVVFFGGQYIYMPYIWPWLFSGR